MRRQLKFIALIFVVAILMGGEPAPAQVSVGTSVFNRGNVNVSFTGGLGYSMNNNYLVLGTGLSYYVLNGLSVGVAGEAWLGSSPEIYKVSPEVRYVFYKQARLKPYMGAFYRRTFFEGENDLDSFGGRIGVYTRVSPHAWGGLGLVGEKYLSCNDRDYSSCSAIYPELSVAVGF